MNIQQSFMTGFARGLQKRAGLPVDLAKDFEGVTSTLRKHIPGPMAAIKKHPYMATGLASALASLGVAHALRNKD